MEGSSTTSRAQGERGVAVAREAAALGVGLQQTAHVIVPTRTETYMRMPADTRIPHGR